MILRYIYNICIVHRTFHRPISMSGPPQLLRRCAFPSYTSSRNLMNHGGQMFRMEYTPIYFRYGVYYLQFYFFHPEVIFCSRVDRVCPVTTECIVAMGSCAKNTTAATTTTTTTKKQPQQQQQQQQQQQRKQYIGDHFASGTARLSPSRRRAVDWCYTVRQGG